MDDRILILMRPRSLARLTFRWTVVLIIALVVVVPVWLYGGAWSLLAMAAAFFLILSAIAIGLEWFAADTIEFSSDRIRLTAGAGTTDVTIGSLRIEKPLWLVLLKGRGLLVKSTETNRYVLVLGEKKAFDDAAGEIMGRIEGNPGVIP